MKQTIVNLIEFLSFNKIRGQRPAQSLAWWWTPWTYRFHHGGWVCLTPKWFSRFGKLTPILLAFTLLGCASVTPQQQQAITSAENIASMAVGIYASSPGSKISPAQAAQVQQLIALSQANPQAAAIASNSLYGGMAMAQAGVPVAQGASAAPVGSAIATAVPTGLSTNDKAALLAQAAALVANPKAAL